jgi:hypothetical protein
MQILASCPAPRTSYSLPIERAGCFALTAVGTAVAAAAAAAAVRSQFPQSHILSRWLHRLLSFCTYTPPPPRCCTAVLHISWPLHALHAPHIIAHALLSP